MKQRAREVLKTIFGYDSYRGQQEKVVEHTLVGGDSLVLMPTGGGKSLCYQIPAIVRPGVAVVVSPLIALMQDQVGALELAGARAAFLNSTLGYEETRQVYRRLFSGELDLLYMAPERLLKGNALEALAKVPLALFAIDEAHCVSQWGHDFRKDYLELAVLHERFPRVPRLACTATADELTRKEIIARLKLEEAVVFISGFDRPNIRYHIAFKNNPRRQLLRFLLREHKGDSGIVYCMTRKKTEAIAEYLRGEGWDALAYHAGMALEERKKNQNRFLREDGVIIVATIAFGMGIDKPNVRFVAHMDLPKSVEAYYQETGRAGRDGEPSDAWMVYGIQDIVMLRGFIENSEADEPHKRVERRKLDYLVGLCEVTSCRRQALLKYFGDKLAEPCGNCDTCLAPPETWDATEAAQKALSCIYRTDQRFGAEYLIDVLLGADTERILQYSHNRLSTFGIGADLGRTQWRSVFRQLTARGFVEVNADRFGALQLTGAAREILRGKQTLRLRKYTKPETRKAERAKTRKSAKHKIPVFLDPDEKILLDVLKKRRKEIADGASIPAYRVFNDATLRELANKRPETPEEMLDVSGVGDYKLKRYGSEFLAIIRDAGIRGKAGPDS